MALKTKLLAGNFKATHDSPITIINKLGQHGNRSLVTFFSSLNISYLDFELIDRFFMRQVSTLYVLYFNNTYKKYTQKQNHFPNLFLADCLVMDGKDFEDAHQPHMHTYWLKYFILKTIVDRKKIKFNEILDIFCAIGGYDDHLVRHVAGSLCTANEFRCAEVDYDETCKNLDTYKIKPTERGRSLFSKINGLEFCFDFEYLEIIIDDHWLSLPNPYCDLIYFPKMNYSHLFYSYSKYQKTSIDTVFVKAKGILNFIKVLEAAYLIEIKQQKPQLNTILVENKMVPQFDFIRNSIVNTAAGIVQALRKDSELSRIQELKDYKIRLDNDQSFTEFFKEYYRSAIKVSA